MWVSLLNNIMGWHAILFFCLCIIILLSILFKADHKCFLWHCSLWNVRNVLTAFKEKYWVMCKCIKISESLCDKYRPELLDLWSNISAVDLFSRIRVFCSWPLVWMVLLLHLMPVMVSHSSYRDWVIVNPCDIEIWFIDLK